MDARELLGAPLDDLCAEARRLRDAGHGPLVTYSPKVFVPLTTLCRDVCGYCTFARPPRRGERAFMTLDEVLAIARAGAAAGCHEALFTLGDKPETALPRRPRGAPGARLRDDARVPRRRRAGRARRDRPAPHLNPGLMRLDDLRALRRVSASMGIMLETLADRLATRGQAHWASPDKLPAARLATIAAAGEVRVPFTSGILIGIGETRAERLDALLALRDAGGHVQEVIVQNFRAKPGTRMAGHPEPSLDEHLWTIAAARVILGPRAHVQAPPNLAYDDFPRLLDAGIDDWGGVSPVTIDHVNPEAPWPDVERLRAATESRGLELAPRLALYPEYVAELDTWCDPAVAPLVRRRADALGLAREDPWAPGEPVAIPRAYLVRRDALPLDVGAAGRGGARAPLPGARPRARSRPRRRRRAPPRGQRRHRHLRRQPEHQLHERLLLPLRLLRLLEGQARGEPARAGVSRPARRDRAPLRGGVGARRDRGLPPGRDPSRVHGRVLPRRRARAARRAARPARPRVLPLEVWQGAATLGLPLDAYLARLRDAGLGTLPGTAAEILDDEIRAVICPDKVSTAQWLEVMRTAHGAGLRTTSTIMFGHVESPRHWARHLLRLRELQRETGGFTEFVPLPFVHMEAPIALKGRARSGPTFGETLLLHAVARLALHPWITNVQASWVKAGPEGAAALLRSGVNDLGGTLMNESISRAAGAAHGQELHPSGWRS